MKKTLLVLASLFMTMGAFADEVTFDFVNNGLKMFPGITVGSTQDGQDQSTLTHDGDITENKTATIDGVTLEVTPSGKETNPNRIWTVKSSGATSLRYYGGTMTITAPKNIKEIVFVEDSRWKAPTPSTGEFSNKKWIGDASSVVFTFTGQCRLKSIKVIYGDAVVDPVQTVSYTKATTITDGSYLIVANSDGALKAATPITSAKYGYLNVVDATAANDVIAMEAGNEFKFTAVDGGYTIQQPDGKYLYMTGTFNSFNLSDARVDGDVFTVVANADGTFKITNVAMNKYVQYSALYTSFGIYSDEKGVMPSLYKMGTTGLSSVTADKFDANAPIFNLAGQRVSKDAKGILIQNGKKFVVK